MQSKSISNSSANVACYWRRLYWAMYTTTYLKKSFYLIVGIFVGTASVPLYAAEVAGVYYRDDLLVDSTELRLTGVGLLRYWGFKAYTGALYLQEGAPIDDVLADRAKRIELEYFRSLNGKDF